MAANDSYNYGYDQLIGKRFTGKYVGKDQNPQGNDGIKSIFEKIRQSVGNQVRLILLSLLITRNTLKPFCQIKSVSKANTTTSPTIGSVVSFYNVTFNLLLTQSFMCNFERTINSILTQNHKL